MARVLIAITALVFCAGSGGMAADASCERPIAKSDIFIDVGGGDLSIIFANISDACTINFVDVYDVEKDPLRAVPWFVFVRVRDRTGKTLSETDLTDDWFGYTIARLIFSDGPPTWRRPTLLKAREAWVVRVPLCHMMEHLSLNLVHEKRPDLPWGKTVVIEAAVKVVSKTPGAASTALPSARVQTEPFLYNLRASFQRHVELCSSGK